MSRSSRTAIIVDSEVRAACVTSPALPRQITLFLTGCLLFLFLLAVGGCGEEEEAILDAGFETETGVTVEQGLQPADEPVLTADDIPVATGVRHVYLASTPGIPADVSFDLEGPWDLDAGPATTTVLETEYIDRDDAPLEDELPDADLVSRYEWEDAVAPTEYIYQTLAETAWVVFGRTVADAVILELEGTSRLLLFPLTVNDTWQDSYTEIAAEERLDVTVDGTVLAFDDITVPAGTYTAFLVRTSVSVTGPDEVVTTTVYTWFAPGVGRVAEIVSLPGEENDPFTSAASIFILGEFDDGS